MHRWPLGKEPTVPGPISHKALLHPPNKTEKCSETGVMSPMSSSPVPAVHLQAHHRADEPRSLEVIMFVTLGVPFISFPGRVVRKPELCHILWRSINNADVNERRNLTTELGRSVAQPRWPGKTHFYGTRIISAAPEGKEL